MLLRGFEKAKIDKCLYICVLAILVSVFLDVESRINMIQAISALLVTQIALEA